MQAEWDQYDGEETFIFRVIERCDGTKKELLKREQFWLDTLNPEWNSSPYAIGSVATTKTRRKISVANSGHKVSPETRAKNKCVS
jgi:hypothetical protein